MDREDATRGPDPLDRHHGSGLAPVRVPARPALSRWIGIGAGIVMDGEATWVGLIDLEDPDGLRPVGPQMRTDHADARVLVRVHGVPLGFVELPLRRASIDPDDVLREALHRHGEALSRHLRSDGLD